MTLAAGTKAPPFSAVDHDGRPARWEDLLGMRTVLYFFPKADTSG